MIGWAIGTFCLRYDINFWASYFKGVEVHMPLIPCFIGAVILGWPATVVAVLTWICSFFM
jgi:hypothetical protein